MQSAYPRAPRFSIIIPTFDEEVGISAAVMHAHMDSDTEVIVADGGSRDQTCEHATRHGARVTLGDLGRARQMNLGATIATGACLVFLHADTRIPEGGLEEAWRALEDEAVAIVTFSLRIDHPGAAFRIIESAANLRSKALGLPYGDQVFCVRRPVFDAMGGFREDVLLEDVDFARRARAEGRIRVLAGRAPTSPRRWLQGGVLRTSLTNQLLLASHVLGIPPRWLTRARRRPDSLRLPRSETGRREPRDLDRL